MSAVPFRGVVVLFCLLGTSCSGLAPRDDSTLDLISKLASRRVLVWSDARDRLRARDWQAFRSSFAEVDVEELRFVISWSDRVIFVEVNTPLASSVSETMVARVYDHNAVLLSHREFRLGGRLRLSNATLRPMFDTGESVIELGVRLGTTSDDIARQYYGLVGDNLELIRVESLEGEIVVREDIGPVVATTKARHFKAQGVNLRVPLLAGLWAEIQRPSRARSLGGVEDLSVHESRWIREAAAHLLANR